MTVSESLKAARISPKTDRDIAEVRLAEAGRRGDIDGLKLALYGVEYARQTSRIHGGAEMAIRAMTGYQYAKFVLGFVGVSQDTIARSINMTFSA